MTNSNTSSSSVGSCRNSSASARRDLPVRSLSLHELQQQEPPPADSLIALVSASRTFPVMSSSRSPVVRSSNNNSLPSLPRTRQARSMSAPERRCMLVDILNEAIAISDFPPSRPPNGANGTIGNGGNAPIDGSEDLIEARQ